MQNIENGGCFSDGAVSEFSTGDSLQKRNPVQISWFGEIKTLDVMNAEQKCQTYNCEVWCSDSMKYARPTQH